MQKVYIHIGTHKTGTTTIQNFMRANREFLNINNCNFIEIPSELDRQMAWLDNYHNDDLINEAKNYFIKTINNKKNIISSEGLVGTYLQAYTNSSFIAHFLYEVFKDYDVTIILYLRRQDEFFESLYTQHIHEGGGICFLKNFIENLIKKIFLTIII